MVITRFKKWDKIRQFSRFNNWLLWIQIKLKRRKGIKSKKIVRVGWKLVTWISNICSISPSISWWQEFLTSNLNFCQINSRKSLRRRWLGCRKFPKFLATQEQLKALDLLNSTNKWKHLIRKSRNLVESEMNSREVKARNQIRIAKLWSKRKLLPLKWDGIKHP